MHSLQVTLLSLGAALWMLPCQAQEAPVAAPLKASLSAQHAPLYHESGRPQFHFTAQSGWLNDPNGLVYFDGEYHLFFQSSTQLDGQDSAKLWGHAVSPDLVHWHQLDNALVPDALGAMWSGSAVIDWNNTSGFGRPGHPPMVALYTAAGGFSPQSQGRSASQCLAYSTDKGRTLTKYAQNPVLPHITGVNRDPRVVWYAPTRHWILALYLDGDQFGLFSSPNLKAWTQIQTLTLPGSSECPDFFSVPLEGTQEHRWVFMAANDHYLVGAFDGKTFTPETPSLPGDTGANFYAAQTFSDIPARDGRRIQIAWMAVGSYPNMPFNQQMSFPCTLTLHSTPDGPRLFRQPVREIEKLYTGSATHLHGVTVQPGSDYMLPKIKSDLLDISAEFAVPPGTKAFGMRVHGADVRYDAATGTLHCLNRQATLVSASGYVTLRLLLDRTSLEVYGNSGSASLTSCFMPSAADDGISLYAEGGPVTLVSLTAHPLQSAWPGP